MLHEYLFSKNSTKMRILRSTKWLYLQPQDLTIIWGKVFSTRLLSSSEKRMVRLSILRGTQHGSGSSRPSWSGGQDKIVTRRNSYYLEWVTVLMSIKSCCDPPPCASGCWAQWRGWSGFLPKMWCIAISCIPFANCFVHQTDLYKA